MTSILFKHKSTRSSSSIAAQELLTLKDTVVKNGLLRKRGNMLNIGKWPFRFIVLSFDHIYIFDDETSKVQNSKFSLIGYNKVTRCDVSGQSWCFSIVPAVNLDSLSTKTFACISDEDRRSWMKAIKNQMYVANNIPIPVNSITDKIKSMTITNGDDYTSLEQLVYTPPTGIPTQVDFLNVDDDDDDDDDDNYDESNDSSASSQANVAGIKKVQPPETGVHTITKRNSSSSVSTEYESVEPINSTKESLTTNVATLRRKPTDPQPRPPVDQSETPDFNRRRCPDQVKPPRYSEVCFYDNDEPDLAGTYVNTGVNMQNALKKTQQNTLESMCTVTDPKLDRNQLILILQGKREQGTYLIRRSRQGDQKVIAYLDENGKVKEYKIMGTVDRPTLDSKKSFSCIEELLRHYTLLEQLPNTTSFLRKGIYQTGD